MAYPSDRLRRLRRLRAFRNMVRETRVHRSDLILPLFVVEGTGIVEEARELSEHPLAAYNVSGEYAMGKAFLT